MNNNQQEDNLLEVTIVSKNKIAVLSSLAALACHDLFTPILEPNEDSAIATVGKLNATNLVLSQQSSNPQIAYCTELTSFYRIPGHWMKLYVDTSKYDGAENEEEARQSYDLVIVVGIDDDILYTATQPDCKFWKGIDTRALCGIASSKLELDVSEYLYKYLDDADVRSPQNDTFALLYSFINAMKYPTALEIYSRWYNSKAFGNIEASGISNDICGEKGSRLIDDLSSIDATPDDMAELHIGVNSYTTSNHTFLSQNNCVYRLPTDELYI